MRSYKHILIDPKIIRDAMKRRENVRGVNITIGVSGSELPRAATAREVDGVLEIRFDYIGEESTRRVVLDKVITFIEGKNSGKIFGLDVLVKENQLKVVELLINKIEERKQLVPKERGTNYGVIEKVLEERGRELVGAD
jgi:hypothetical protein